MPRAVPGRPRPTPLRLLVTAGPTREYLDPVRFLSNDSSGRMGFALAAAATGRGLRVTLVHGPVALQPPVGVRTVAVVSARQMLAACRQLWPTHDALLMAAAVADYAPARPARRKLKKSRRPLTVRLEPTPDILAELAAGRERHQVVVGFALEDRAGRRNAARKLVQKDLDAIVLNRPAAIGAQRSEIEILVRGKPWLAPIRGTKRRHADRLVRLVIDLHAGKSAADA